MTIRTWPERRALVTEYWKLRQDKNILQCSTGKINGSFTPLQKAANSYFLCWKRNPIICITCRYESDKKPFLKTVTNGHRSLRSSCNIVIHCRVSQIILISSGHSAVCTEFPSPWLLPWVPFYSVLCRFSGSRSKEG